MNADDRVCPTDERLQAFSRDELDALDTASVQRHLESCTNCRLVADGLRGTYCANVDTLSGETAHTFVLDTASPDELHTFSAWSTNNRLTGGTALAEDSSGQDFAQQLAANSDFEFVRVLGRNGLSVACLVRNRSLDRLEFLKIMSRASTDHPGAVERLQLDIRLAARLNHPNIAATYNLFWLGELLALSMEYVAGQSLQLVARRNPLTPDLATRYVYQAALGLQHAHERGLLHRDIRPAQLMLAVEGNRPVVKILNFGLSRAASQRAIDGSLVADGQRIAGAFDCIAPEYTLAGGQADIRADIYSLGCTLYYLLAGRPPFSGDRLSEILRAHHCADPEPLGTIRSDVSAQLANVVQKMMAKHPARRYQSPGEAAAALEPLLAAEPFYGTSPGSSITSTSFPLPRAMAVVPRLPTERQGNRPAGLLRRSVLSVAGACLVIAVLAIGLAVTNSRPVDDVAVTQTSEPRPADDHHTPQPTVVRDVAGLRARFALQEVTDKSPAEGDHKGGAATAGSQAAQTPVVVGKAPAQAVAPPTVTAPMPEKLSKAAPAANRPSTLQPKVDALRRDYAERVRKAANNRETLAAIAQQRLTALRALAAEGERERSPDHRVLANIYADLQQWDQVVKHAAKASEHSAADEQLFQQQIMALLSLHDAAGAERVITKAKAALPESMSLAAMEFRIVAAQALQQLREEKPDLAEQTLEVGRVKLAQLREKFSGSSKLWDSSQRSLDSVAGQIKSLRKRLDLLGKPAIPLVADAWVNGPRLSENDLRGKVVLLDFFAVWCGPCVSTFPHLKEWRDTYRAQGLVIVGVTNYYQYGWDAAGQHIKRAEDLTHSAEADALQAFLKHHELQHSVAIMANHEFASHYTVSGIPQAVVIDRSGKVRMIRVGSGPKNADDLEKCMRECLAERPEQAISRQ